MAVSWLSAAAFGLYILAFYLLNLYHGQMQRWNEQLPGLYKQHHLFGLAAMSVHLFTGAVILLLGPIQLVGGVRRRWPRAHRWMGRVYVAIATVAGLGGLGFIVSTGTIGGPVMDFGFGLYGALMALAAVETYRHARALRFDEHRAWGIRLVALAIGSWLYRMDYGVWLTAAHGLGHTHTFRGPFDVFMSFFFYLPNLAAAELFLRARRVPSHAMFRIVTTAVLTLAALVVGVGTYYFLRFYWGPGILDGFLNQNVSGA